MTTVQELYGELWAAETTLDDELGSSLDPRGTDSLFELFAALGPQTGELVVDIGARDAKHTIRLVREHGLRGIAIDPVPVHLDAAKAAVAEAALTDDILVLDGRIEALPLEDAVADWIWCRDVLPHVDVGPAFGECARVLRPGGRMLVYATLATGLLEPREAWTLYDAVAVVAESMDRAAVEDAARAARLTLVSRTALGGEWRERMVEDGAWDAGGDLLRLSRLRRREDELVDRHGATRIAAYRGGKIWGIYQLLGKLCPTVYVWRRDA